MNSIAETLYRKSPVFVQNLLLSAYGIQLKRIRYGGQFEEYLQSLRANERLSAAELSSLQEENLRNLIVHCYQNVPYYRELFETLHLAPEDIRSVGDLQKLPILEKETVRSQPRRFQAANYLDRRVEVVGTSGTTGTTLRFPVDLVGRRKNYAFFERFKGWAGVSRYSRTATFAGRTIVAPDQQEPPFWRKNWAANTLLLSSYHLSGATVPSYVEALQDWSPELIDSYPSSLESLVADGYDISLPQLRAVITSSETLLDHQRSAIEKALKAKIFDQYGNAEQVCFISQCEQLTYHIHSDYGITELLQTEEPDIARIIATGFTNWAMPLLRYNTGDVVISGTSRNCACGRSFPRVAGIVGRLDDLIVTPSGRRIGRLDPIFKGLESVRQAQIVQDAPDHITIKIVTDGLFRAQDTASIGEQLTRRVGHEMNIDFEMVPEIPRGPGGKFRAVVSQIKSAVSTTKR